ncbi:hypothetical protein OAS39_08310 [Pirellulales bacterium]|nr:hypothetical protein [Pirellulales bacterium]
MARQPADAPLREVRREQQQPVERVGARFAATAAPRLPATTCAFTRVHSFGGGVDGALEGAPYLSQRRSRDRAPGPSSRR